ncbi:hypothetical protein Pfo_025503 [Paulownia fortunei]|nr:hypothetical protein Pfo_025503 [Paulownia fortunei]
MASKVFLIIVITFAMAAAHASAIDYVVGDDEGWTLGVNYSAWAMGKDFRVGDTLAFMYAVGSHNVVKVNSSDFLQCVVPNASNALTSGNDVITLLTPGKKWYICGVGDHCLNGMKLVITVFSTGANAPAPTSEAPAPAPTSVAPAPAPTSGAPMPGTLPGSSRNQTTPGSSAANRISTLRSFVWMLAALAFYTMTMA